MNWFSCSVRVSSEEIDHIVDDLCCEYAPGKLTPDQFREAINDLNLNFDISVKNDKSFSMWMEILDADGDGYVDMKEFQKFYHCVILQVSHDPSLYTCHFAL